VTPLPCRVHKVGYFRHAFLAIHFWVPQYRSSQCIRPRRSAPWTMKTKSDKKSSKQLRHAPLGNELEKPAGKLRPPRALKDVQDDEDNVEEISDEMEEKIFKQAKDQRKEFTDGASGRKLSDQRWANAGSGSDSEEVRFPFSCPPFTVTGALTLKCLSVV